MRRLRSGCDCVIGDCRLGTAPETKKLKATQIIDASMFGCILVARTKIELVTSFADPLSLSTGFRVPGIG